MSRKALALCWFFEEWVDILLLSLAESVSVIMDCWEEVRFRDDLRPFCFLFWCCCCCCSCCDCDLCCWWVFVAALEDLPIFFCQGYKGIHEWANRANKWALIAALLSFDAFLKWNNAFVRLVSLSKSFSWSFKSAKTAFSSWAACAARCEWWELQLRRNGEDDWGKQSHLKRQHWLLHSSWSWMDRKLSDGDIFLTWPSSPIQCTHSLHSLTYLQLHLWFCALTTKFVMMKIYRLNCASFMI